jgi:pimeloyl-ACP methyl ester carboxylesterase
MRRVISKDGTPIAYEAVGTGPAVVLGGGGLDDGSENAPLAGELARSFTVYNYARRGRGDSGNTPPYAREREIEDIEALLDAAGGTAHLYGVSTGGALVLEAAAASVPAGKLAVYEVPYNAADEWRPRWQQYVEELGAALADGRPSDALELFMQLTGSSEAEIASARSSPSWPTMEALAHTLAYDAACLGDGHPPTGRLAGITQPTLVATGAGARVPGAPAWVLALDPIADTIAASIPHAERRTLEGQSHLADPRVVAPLLEQFFGA